MKLTTITHVSVDGVTQGLGGPDEDRGGGFERGGWVLPLLDDEAGALLGELYQRAAASCSAGARTRSSPATGEPWRMPPTRSRRR